jgi:talin
MAALSLKISLEGGKVVKTIQFDPSTTVYDACRIIKEKILEATTSDREYYLLDRKSSKRLTALTPEAGCNQTATGIQVFSIPRS